MNVLKAYHAELGAVINRHNGTLVQFAGDGILVLVNAPVECNDPAGRAILIATEMQVVIQALAAKWKMDGDRLGFGVGMAKGEANRGNDRL